MTKVDMYHADLTSGVKDSKSIYTESSYNAGGNYVTTSRDQRDNASTYAYNEIKGTLTASKTPKGEQTVYEYNASNDALQQVTAKGTSTGSLAQVTYNYDEKGRLSKIISGLDGAVRYSFDYDAFGNKTTTKVGTATASSTLSTNTYKAYNGPLSQITYGNGKKAVYTYDSDDRIIGVKYDAATTNQFEYVYDAEGRLAKSIDNNIGTTYNYYYDILGRPMSVAGSDGSKKFYSYDSTSKVTNQNFNFAGKTFASGYEYNIYKDNALSKIAFKSGTGNTNFANLEYYYDSLGRMNMNQMKIGSKLFRKNIGFVDVSTTRTTNLIDVIRYADYGTSGKSFFYDYDANGNITKIFETNGSAAHPTTNPYVTYTYDGLGQVVTENHSKAGNRVYTYDNRGNITKRTITNICVDTFTYDDPMWKDLLTSYNGKAISYDAIGNPTAYDGWTFTWSRGRTLSSMNKTGKSLSFKYNENGIRTQKTYNGITTNFFLDGSKVVGQKTGSEIIYFQYDANGAPTVMNYNGTNYYYVYNGQGDVVALYNSSGAIVCEYEYDSWGNPAPLTGSLAATVGTKNPFRYRGYYYDTETGLYYLNSRYYNPEWCRFINADGRINTSQGALGTNMFAYCNNNPVNMSDSNGTKPGDLFDSADEAARDFAMCYNELSISNNAEYGTSIYSTTVTVTRYRMEVVWGFTISFSSSKGFYLQPYIKRFKKVSYKTKVTKYSYKAVRKGGSSSVLIPWSPMFKKTVAIAHTHAAYDSAYANDVFSSTDIKTATRKKVPSYVATPLGTLRRYNPSDGSDIELYDDIPWDSNHPSR